MGEYHTGLPISKRNVLNSNAHNIKRQINFIYPCTPAKETWMFGQSKKLPANEVEHGILGNYRLSSEIHGPKCISGRESRDCSYLRVDDRHSLCSTEKLPCKFISSLRFPPVESVSHECCKLTVFSNSYLSDSRNCVNTPSTNSPFARSLDDRCTNRSDLPHARSQPARPQPLKRSLYCKTLEDFSQFDPNNVKYFLPKECNHQITEILGEKRIQKEVFNEFLPFAFIPSVNEMKPNVSKVNNVTKKLKSDLEKVVDDGLEKTPIYPPPSQVKSSKLNRKQEIVEYIRDKNGKTAKIETSADRFQPAVIPKPVQVLKSVKAQVKAQAKPNEIVSSAETNDKSPINATSSNMPKDNIHPNEETASTWPKEKSRKLDANATSKATLEGKFGTAVHVASHTVISTSKQLPSSASANKGADITIRAKIQYERVMSPNNVSNPKPTQ